MCLGLDGSSKRLSRNLRDLILARMMRTPLRTHLRAISTKSIILSQKKSPERIVALKDELKRQRQKPSSPQAATNTIADFDIFGPEPNKARNSIHSITENAFILGSGAVVRCLNPSKPKALVLLGEESFLLDLKGAMTDDKSGTIEIEKEALSFFEVLDPVPDLLVVGLGKKSRVLGPKTSNYLRSFGMQLDIANSVYGATNFDIMNTERPGYVVGALLLPPNY